MWLYISGPYTNGDPVINVRKAVEVADILLAAGHVPIIPHLSHLWHIISPHSWQEWIKLDLLLLERCDGMIRIQGESKGADLEEARAHELGLFVIHINADADAGMDWLRHVELYGAEAGKRKSIQVDSVHLPIYSIFEIASFRAKLRPATHQEYRDWLKGYRENGVEATFIMRQSFYDPDSNTFGDGWQPSWYVVNIVDNNVVAIPELYGTKRLHIIVPAGIKIIEDTPLGHNAVYLMDGFRVLGDKEVPIYSDT